jgi:hypothetical protein
MQPENKEISMGSKHRVIKFQSQSGIRLIGPDGKSRMVGSGEGLRIEEDQAGWEVFLGLNGTEIIGFIGDEEAQRIVGWTHRIIKDQRKAPRENKSTIADEFEDHLDGRKTTPMQAGYISAAAKEVLRLQAALRHLVELIDTAEPMSGAMDELNVICDGIRRGEYHPEEARSWFVLSDGKEEAKHELMTYREYVRKNQAALEETGGNWGWYPASEAKKEQSHGS